LLKINFTDFWPGFEKENNYFYNLLSRHYEVQISDEPELLFFSCYGDAYLRYKCTRIFYSSENERPDFSGCDYALTFDFLDHPRHFRLPLYGVYIEQRNGLDSLLAPQTRELAAAAWAKKTKFCCMVVSNGLSKKRIDFFHKLSSYRQVDSGGRYLNNIGGPVDDKLKFINDYKFVIAFENSAYPGYTTEKILDPFFVKSIPVYWGNNLVGKDFNKKAFLDYSDFPDEEALIQKMIEIEQNPELAVAMLCEPVFPKNTAPEYIDENRVLAFLKMIIENHKSLTPVSKTHQRFIHQVRRGLAFLTHYYKAAVNRNFR